MFLFACMHVCVCVLYMCVVYVCSYVRYIEASHSLWNYSSASTLMWVLDIELRSSGLCAKCLIHCDLQLQPLSLFSCDLSFQKT